ncbi:MAG TPA: hypothetical protein VII95_12210 [Terriglobales bacterium]|jgi:hypothetical protein
MPPYKILFLCGDCVASAPVLEALRVGGFRLRIAHSFHQVTTHRGERADVIVILSPHHANAWIARVKLLAGVPAPVIVLCSGHAPLTEMLPPVDAVCHAESLKSVLSAVLLAASSSSAPVQMLYPPLAAGYQPI